MIFNTYWFVCFAAVFFPVYWLLLRPGLRQAWLLAGCAVFHWHFAGLAGVLPIAALGTCTYLLGLTRRRSLCLAGIGLGVATLCFYKYALFVAQDVLGALDPGWGAALARSATAHLPLLPPLAISFFTFEFIHYLFEVRRGREPIRAPLDFALFAIHFPSLVAGPIKRYQDYLPNLRAGLARVSVDDVAAGVQQVALGAVKKLLLADNLTLVINNHEGRFAELSSLQSWLFLGAISARILLDFGGYSDMAIGLSRLLGIPLPENFNFPYLARNLRDFWQRWHISLSTWIRDYIYIPLGGNRHGPVRQLASGSVAFALCGLWHGPAWHFVLWGLWHGAGLAVATYYPAVLGPAGRELAAMFKRWPPLGWALTLLHVSLGWLLFFYEPRQAWSMAAQLLGW